MAHLDNSSDFHISFALAPSEANLIPDSVVRRASETVAGQLLSGTAITLLTSTNREGKTRFLKSLLHGLKSDLRSIYLDSQDLYQPSADDEESRIRGSKQSFQTMLSYLKESVSLGEQLVIVIDNADELASQVFEECITPLLSPDQSSQKVSFLLAGLPSLIALTQYAMGVRKFGVALCSLDELSVKELKEFIDFQQLPANQSQKYSFEESALREIATQASGSLLKASVLLEWCRVYLGDKAERRVSKATVADVSTLLFEKSKTENKNYFTHYPDNGQSLDAFEETIVLPPKGVEPVINSSRLDLEETQVTPQSLYFDLDSEKPPEEAPVIVPSSEPERKPKPVEQISQASSAPTLTPTNTHSEPPSIRRWPILVLVFAFAGAYYWIYTETQKHPLQAHTQTTSQPQQATTAKNTNEGQGITAKGSLALDSSQTELSNLSNIENRSKIETQEPGQSDTAQPANRSGDISALANTDTSMLNQLLSLAQAQYDEKKLTTPENDNAFNTYQIILRLSPNHPDAITGLGQIKQRYLRWAQVEIAEKRNDRARLFYERALLIDPNDADIKQKISGLQ